MTTQTLGAVRAHDDLDEEVMRLFDMVTTGLETATAAFLEGDRVAARALVADDQLIDNLHSAIEDRVQRELATRVGDRTEDAARRLISMLQIVPEIERSADLVEHIALRTPQGLAQAISPRARGMVQEMGRIGVAMWRAAAAAYLNRDPEALSRLRTLDDELDDLHVSLSAELAESATSIPVAIEMGLVARFYERIGDHAVNITRRIRRMAP
jgi:phosphate transport system protein